jgi:hypothetical protein
MNDYTNCKICLASIRKDEKSKRIIYILSEIYDESIKNIDTLKIFHLELISLYDFKIENSIPTNIEDFRYFQNRYKLTGLKKLKDGVYSAPFLYDVSCRCRMFRSAEEKNMNLNSVTPSISLQYSTLCIVFPYHEPTVRKSILDYVCIINPKFVILTGGCYKENKVKTSTLMKDYLKKLNTPSNIIELNFNCKKDCITEAIEIVSVIDKILTVFVACKSEDILGIKKIWRSIGGRKRYKLYFLCPFV